MTVQNKNLRYRIVIEDIVSNTQQIPVSSITGAFVVNEVVTGDDSGAQAVVREAAGLSDTAIVIKTKTGNFRNNEGLTGSVSGIAVKDDTIEVTDTPYTNSSVNITDGTWTLENDDDQLVSVKNPVQKINISKGGNLGSGYTFGFSVLNFGLAQAITEDGVYFKNRRCTFYLGDTTVISTTWTKEWTGLIDSVKAVSEGTVEFRCTDLTKDVIENLGSEEVPIALNRNYNCKLVLPENNKSENVLVSRTVNGTDYIDNFVNKIDIGKKIINVIVYNSGDWSSFNVNKHVLFVSLGKGSGVYYKVTKIVLIKSYTNNSVWDFYVTDDVSALQGRGSGTSTPYVDTSLVRAIEYSDEYILSESAVNKVHENISSSIEKPLRIINEDYDFFLSAPNDYDESINSDGNQAITIKNLDENGNIKTGSLTRFATPGFNPTTVHSLYAGASFIGTFIVGSFTFTESDFENLTHLFKSEQEVKLDLGQLTLKNTITGAGSVVISEGSTVVQALYKDQILANGRTDLHRRGQAINAVSTIDGNDLVVDFSAIFEENSDDYILSNYSDREAIKNLSISVNMFVQHSGGFAEPTEYIVENSGFRIYGDLPTDDIAIGCNGENVQSGNEFENVPDTITYLLSKLGKGLSDIDTQSFTDAQSDFAKYVNDPERNAAHQIIEQNDSLQLLKDILYSHMLGMYVNRSGEYRMVNWLPKSIVFSDTPAEVIYTENEFEFIGRIERDDLNSVISDCEFDFNLSESQGDFLNKLRIKNTNEDSFDFQRDSEGIDTTMYGLAESAWKMYKAGHSRLRKLSQTKISSKWIKAFYSKELVQRVQGIPFPYVGTGEALSFVRNLGAHLNRQHEYVKIRVPINEQNSGNELLSFISVNDQKITDGRDRKGWIVDRKIDLSENKLEYKLLLDIDPYDPFLYKVNVWRDGDFTDNVKTDGNFPSNKKINGDGIVI